MPARRRNPRRVLAMTRTALSLTLLAAVLVCLLHASPARAAPPIRVYVSITGSDANQCTFASPCHSVQHAHDVVQAGGEIRMLDPGSYGLLIITKAISILGDGHGGIAASNNAVAITINAGPNDIINLRGLIIEGFGTGFSGVIFNTGASLNIQDSIIRNFAFDGVVFQPTAASQLNVRQTIIEHFGGLSIAVAIAPSGSGSAKVVLDNVAVDSSLDGVYANGSNTSGSIIMTVADSVISNNGSFGIGGASTNGAIQIMVRNCTISNNNEGIESNGSPVVIRVTRSTITANIRGVLAGNSGLLISYGDNNIDGNTANGSPTSTIVYH